MCIIAIKTVREIVAKMIHGDSEILNYLFQYQKP